MFNSVKEVINTMRLLIDTLDNDWHNENYRENVKVLIENIKNLLNKMKIKLSY
ncbi:hypothetical protein [Spiroplasma endosymbiont of Nebria brevicollis]|uniref:hypothetical protein n=1 Tax=Spiroplasma endosymbiont of Nebria brevicollis TaxID=3066284 RepID=UPI00313E888F